MEKKKKGKKRGRGPPYTEFVKKKMVVRDQCTMRV